MATTTVYLVGNDSGNVWHAFFAGLSIVDVAESQDDRLILDQISFPASSSQIMVVKTNTLTLLQDRSLLNSIISSVPSFEIFFMAKWMDIYRYYQFISVHDHFKVVRTFGAHGFHALVFSESGLEKLKARANERKDLTVASCLNSIVSDGSALSVTTVPSLMEYDVFRAPPHHTAPYLFTCEFQGGAILPQRPHPRRVSDDLQFFWAMVITMVVIITICVFSSLQKRWT